MDRHITPKFDIPAGSFGASVIITFVVAKKGDRTSCSCAAMVSLTVVEYVRREIAIQEGLSDKPQAMVHISALWILPYAIMSGWASDFNGIGQRILLL
ncbi:hypothetical protein Golax_007152 [Gossypium laxum]|uniref:Uncharacterized protein n=1 Tax=Gossypium laxum TaxID=34288 RepID=A0A7J9A652_9ROSI|nr:hypothetical protein [Gossypium laxum]